MSSERRKASKPRVWIAVVAVAIVVVGVVAGLAILQASAADDLRSMSIVQAQRGPLTISVTEPGSISARDQVIISSEVEGRNSIISLVPEGTEVQAGDLLIELDASGLLDQRVDQEIRVQNAEAAFIRARENLAVTENQTTADIEQAELRFRFAKDDYRKYLDGDYPKQRTEIESRISLARQEVTRARDKLEWSERLFEEQYISQAEFESDRLALERSQLDLQLRQEDLRLLDEFTHARNLAQHESDVRQTEMALERVIRRASADIIQAEADLEARRAERDRQRDRLTKINEQIEKCRIYAPVGGMVIYATSMRGNWRGNAEPLTEGYEVREREELIMLPRASGMMVEVKVHESNLAKLKIGQPARVMVDAMPGQVFWGRVSRIAPLPDQQSIFMNPDLRVYNTEIVLEGDLTGIRPGRNCTAEIIIERYSDAVYVPVQSVLRVGNETRVYLVNGNRIEPRTVTIGLDNNQMVRITSGLEGGERVLLTPPLDEARRAEEMQAAGLGHDQIPEMAEPTPQEPAPQDEQQPTERMPRQMTPEQIEAWQQMTPEERQALQQRLRQERTQGDEQGRPPQDGQRQPRQRTSPSGGGQ